MLIAGSAACVSAQDCAFITNQDSGTVSVIDTTTNTVTRTILLGFFRDESCVEAPLPGAQPNNIAVTSDGTHAYVTMLHSCYLVVIDTRLSQPVDYIFLPGSPFVYGIAIGAHGERVYAATQRRYQANGALLIIETITDAVVGGATVGDLPRDVAIRPDGRAVYVTNTGTFTHPGNTVSVMDTVANAVTATVVVDDHPWGIAITPDGTAAYVGTIGSVDVVDTATNTVTTSIAVPAGFSHVAITPDGKAAYVSSCGAGTCVIDTATNTLKPDILGRGAGIAITSDGAHAYLTQPSSDTVAVISTAANAITARIRMPYCGRLYDSPLSPKAPCSPTGIAIASLPHGCPACPGDCNTDGTVTIDEVMSLVNIALGNGSVGTCPAADPNRNGQVTIREILKAVNVLFLYHDVGSCWAGLTSGQAADQHEIPGGS